MKNAKSVLIGALVAMSISTYADAINVNNNASHISEEKKSVLVLNKVLPVSVTAVETPAPEKVSAQIVKQATAAQKVASVELELKNAPKK